MATAASHGTDPSRRSSLLRQGLGDVVKDDQAFTRAAARAFAHGRPQDAEALARQRPADDPLAITVLAQIAIARGRYTDALQQLAPAAARHPGGAAALELGLLNMLLGRRDDAVRLLTRVETQSANSDAPLDLVRAARAARALGQFQEANALFRQAASAGEDPVVETAWGDLFEEKSELVEAVRSFRTVIKLDDAWAPAYLGLARAIVDETPQEAKAAATKALTIDPAFVPALLFLAAQELDEDRSDEARKTIARALEINPNSLEAHALLAAMANVEGRQAEFEAEVAKVLAINPMYGEVYRVAGDLAARNYRFDEAVALARQAVQLDRDNAEAYADLGMHLLRTGDEPEARRALERAWRADRFNRVTKNLLDLLDILDAFVTVKSGDVVVRLHASEAPVLREYALPLAQQALQVLSGRYEFTPKGPILIEIFPKHDDFAVRNLGLPGMIGALGACFGRVVTLDSPRAQEPGTFNWNATLWHEMAHVITLQMSNQRVPRWLTEGISVFEEKRARPEWGREMELSFAQALERGQVLKLRDLNAGFTRPETIGLAYYEASLLVEHIVASKGDAGLRALLRAYGEGLQTEPALAKALQLTIDQLQTSFDRALAEHYGQIRRALHAPKDLQPGAGVEALRTIAAANPDSFPAQLAFGRALAGVGDRAAFEPLERAAQLLPMATGKDSPHALMADLAERLGDRARAIRELEALLAQDHNDVALARRLAALADAAGDQRVAALAYDRIVALDPFEAAPHGFVGRQAMKRQDAAVAVREFRAALAAGPVDLAAAHCDLGEAYLLSGNRVEAKREALAALEIAPTFERAQELLLRAAR